MHGIVVKMTYTLALHKCSPHGQHHWICGSERGEESEYESGLRSRLAVAWSGGRHTLCNHCFVSSRSMHWFDFFVMLCSSGSSGSGALSSPAGGAGAAGVSGLGSVAYASCTSGPAYWSCKAFFRLGAVISSAISKSENVLNHFFHVWQSPGCCVPVKGFQTW